jgi:hypothetical protein
VYAFTAIDAGSTVGVNAMVLSVAVAVGAIYISTIYASLRAIEERTFETALSANDIAKGWLLLNTLKSQGPYDTDLHLGDRRRDLGWHI